jgi:REP element-mobilizing transposase RayT
MSAGQPALVIRKRKRLPHWEFPHGIYFATFRLFDSVPESIQRLWVSKRENFLRKAQSAGTKLSDDEARRLNLLLRRKIERYLDSGQGSCMLKLPQIAQVVANALRYFRGKRYTLYAWCVMPNHVHVVFRPLPGHSLARIVHSWKSFSAQNANKLLGRNGPFWQREYYDHLVRNEAQLEKFIRYVSRNPVRAGLKGWPWVEVTRQD